MPNPINKTGSFENNQIKFNHSDIKDFADMILANASLGNNPEVLDDESTIAAKLNADSAMTDEENLRKAVEHMTWREHDTMKKMSNFIKTVDDDIKTFYEKTFDYEIQGSLN